MEGFYEKLFLLLAGGVIALVSPWLSHLWIRGRNRNDFLRDKMEHFLSLIEDELNWLDLYVSHTLLREDDKPPVDEPLNKAMSIGLLYFPSIMPHVYDFHDKVDELKSWVIEQDRAIKEGRAIGKEHLMSWTDYTEHTGKVTKLRTRIVIESAELARSFAIPAGRSTTEKIVRNLKDRFSRTEKN